MLEKQEPLTFQNQALPRHTFSDSQQPYHHQQPNATHLHCSLECVPLIQPLSPRIIPSPLSPSPIPAQRVSPTPTQQCSPVRSAGWCDLCGIPWPSLLWDFTQSELLSSWQSHLSMGVPSPPGQDGSQAAGTTLGEMRQCEVNAIDTHHVHSLCRASCYSCC